MSSNADEDGSGDVSAGDTLTYTITVLNTGTANLTNVTVDDDLTNTVDAPCAASLAPGASCSVDVNYTVQASDLGTTILNTATGDSDQTDPNTDDESVPVPSPSHTTDKALSNNADEDGSGDVSAGDTLTYTITVLNTGTANLTNVTVDDDLTNTVDAPCAASLAPGASCSVDVNYTVQASDLGTTILNTATGDTDQTDPNTDDESVPVPSPSHTTDKALSNNADEDGSGDVSAGDTLTYTITVFNNGTANLTNVTVDDDLTNTVDAPCAASLAPGASCSVDVNYTVQASDLGTTILNTATGDSDQTEPNTDDESVPVPSPSHTTDKALSNNADEDGSGDVSVGDTLTYTITVFNNGTANLTNVTVDDDLTNTVDAPCAASLAPGASCSVDVNYTVQASDLGTTILNTATGDSDQTDPNTDDESVPVPSPSHTTDKALSSNADEDGSGDVSAGDTLTYTITVLNTGTANLTNVTVDDDLTNTVDAPCAASLAPGASCSVDVNYTVTSADVLAGVINNIGTGDSDQTDPSDDPEDVPVPTPSLEIDKTLYSNADEDGSLDVSVGDTLTYHFLVMSTGSANLTNVSVIDPLPGLSAISCPGGNPIGFLAAGNSETCSATYVVTGADVATGSIDNTATADSDQTGPVDDSVTVPVPTPSLNTAKDLTGHDDNDGSGDYSVGDTLYYTITVSNTGTANLTNVTVDDSLTGDSTSCALVVPGEICVLNTSYVVQPGDLGSTINNIGTGDSDQTDPSDDPEDVPVPTPSLEIDKTLYSNADEDGSLDVSVGDTLTYHFLVMSTGSANLTNVSVIDPLPGLSAISCPGGNPIGFLAAGNSETCSATYVVTGADVATGSIDNTATADSDQTGPVDDSVTVPVPTPSLNTAKDLTGHDDNDGSGDYSVGDTLYYTITVSNTGTANLTNVTVDDSLTGDSTSCALVVPGEICVLNTSYVVQPGDLGSTINNIGTGDSDQTDPSDDPEDVPVPTPSLEIDKTLYSNADEDGSLDVSVGDTLTYHFLVMSTGSANLTNVSVIDPLPGLSAISCPGGNPIGFLAAGNSETCSATYVVTGADVAAGSIDNTATADSDQTGPVDDSVTVPVPSPSHTTDKALTNNADEDGSLDVSVGDTLTYTITVLNTGTANLTNVTVDDDLTTTVDALCAAFLAPADSCSVDVQYVVQVSDLGTTILNTATGDSDQTEPNTDNETVPVPSPSHTTDKALSNNADEDGSLDVSVGDTLTYTITVLNTGTANLTNVTVDDDLTTTVDALCAAFLAPADSCSVDVQYVVQVSDLGTDILNTATGDSDQTDPNTDNETVPVPSPSHTTDKALSNNADEDGSLDVSVGDTLTYTITVLNTGTANLTNVTVDDDLTTTVDALCAAFLAPADSCSVDVQYVVQVSDLGTDILNTATGDSDQTDPNTDNETVPVPSPSHTTDKALTNNADEDGSLDVSVGDTLTYTITVLNTGTANLTNVTVDDDLTTTVDALCAAFLAPADSCSVDVQYVVQVSDLGTDILNTATGDSDQTDPNTDNETVPVPSPSHTTDKALTNNADEDGSLDVSVGDTLTYTLTVLNTGTANLTNVTVDDDLTTTVDALCAAFLAPADSCSVDVQYVVQVSDLGTDILNTATGDSDQTDPNTDNETVPVPSPSHTTDKALTNNADEDGSLDVSVGDTLTYTLTVSNNGTANLTNVTVDDDLTGTFDAPCAAFLVPGDSCSVDVYYTVLASDLGTDIFNTATGDSDQTDPNTDTETVPVPSPSHTTDKALTNNADEDGSLDVSVGDTLTYTLTVSNNGTANLTNVTVDDDLTGTFDAPCAAFLVPGDSCSVDVYYTVTSADVFAGVINNIGTGDSDQTDPSDDPEEVLVPTPSLEIDKTLYGNADEDGSLDVSVGDTLTYNFLVTSTGSANLTNVSVNDPLPGLSAISCPSGNPIGFLAAGNSETCSATYVVTGADVAAGSIVNTATADSDQTGPVDDTVDVPVPTPSHTTDKALTNNADEDGSLDVSVGDTLTYTLTVSNNGTANLTNVTVDDDLTGTFDAPCAAFLVPGDSCSVDVYYTVTSADVFAGVINNIGTGDSDQTDPSDDPEEVLVPTPSLEIDKTLYGNADEDGSLDVSVGDTLTYNFLVTSTGSANLTNVSVNDPLPGLSAISCPSGNPIGFLAAGNSETCSATYVVTGADVAAGSIVNTATADSDQTGPVDDTVDVPVPTPSLAIDKQVISITNPDLSDGGTSIDEAGDKITYHIVLTNNGTANLTSVTVDDDLTGTVDAFCAAILAPTESCTVMVMYTANQADLDFDGANPTLNGFIDNTGTGDSVQTDPVNDSEQVPVTQTPSVDIVKTFAADSILAGGAGSSFTLVVTNDGNITLNSVVVTDTVNPDLTVTNIDCAGGTDSSSGQGVECTFATLNVGDTKTITVYFEVDASVPEALGVNNSATANGATDTAGNVTDTDTDSIDILIEIELSITKTFYRYDDNGTNTTSDDIRVEDGKVEQGKTGYFDLVVSNAGPSDAIDVVVTDEVNGLLGVIGASVTSEFGSGSCVVSDTGPDTSTQTIECIANIPVGADITVTVEYIAAEFLNPLDPEAPIWGTEEGDEFRIVFVNGYILEGSTDSNTNGGLIYLIDPDGDVTAQNFIGTKNEITFDPPEGGGPFTIHMSCSDAFTDGWGDSGGPDEFDNSFWQIASYSILRYNNSGFFKGCGDVVVPWDVSNTAFADGVDSNSPPESEEVFDSATVMIIRQLKVEIRNQPVIKGKKMDVLLNNVGEDSLTIIQIDLEWPNGNSLSGDLVEVRFGGSTIYDMRETDSPASITGPWLGTETDRSFAPNEAQKLGFYFSKKTKPGTYKITVTLEGGLTTEVITISRDL